MAPPPQLPKICVAIGHSDASVAEACALQSCDRGETFLELRLDMLADPSAGSMIVRRLRRRHPDAAVLATCRRREAGGHFSGSIARQLSLLRDAVEAGAGMVDVEIETAEQEPGALDPFRDDAVTVLSYHNFDKTPPLRPVMSRLRKTKADIYKIATTVQRPSDNCKLLALCKSHRNLVVVGMGETGAVARLLAPSRGGLFTFASPDPFTSVVGKRPSTLSSPPTAPAQLAASAVRQLYRAQLCKPDTKVYGVIAMPVAHSMSPLIHNRAFKAKRFAGIYLPFLVQPPHLRDFFQSLRELPLAGVSVTIPHKRRVIRFLDSVDPEARGIGAVNTIYWKRNRLVGTNTDVVGITRPLAKRVKLNRSRILIVGNGGAAVAALSALKQQGSEVLITGRNPQRVRRLARVHGVGYIEFTRLDEDYFDVLVQATPVGMLPHVGDTLFPKRIPADVVFDLVYNPLETALLKHAAEDGKVTISGIEMFVEQAAAQFRIWTGLEAPYEVMRNAVLERTLK